MNWLFPIYLAGAVAILAPIMLHLRRRPPQDRVVFSSLLFLDAQVPKPASKRRLENWLLLLLRCLAIILLALMFSRPFWPSGEIAAASASRATLILIDRSASMRREDLWKRAVAGAEKLVREAKITDRIAMAVFDRELKPLWTFEEDRQSPAKRLTALKSRLEPLSPTWAATHLDVALTAAVPSFDSSMGTLKKSIYLLSDLQEGTKLDALRSIAWPEEIALRIERLDPSVRDNLSMSLAASEAEDAKVRLRLTNSRDSALRDFTLSWQKAPLAETITSQIPPGAARILPAPPNATMLNLGGDKHDFDNRVFINPPQPRPVRIHFLGQETTRDDATAPLYYLSRALQPTATLAPQLTVDEKLPAKPADILFVAGRGAAGGMRSYLEGGGFLVVAPTDDTLLQSLGIDATVTPGTGQDYRMLGDVKTGHPLLKPFADPKLRDFTKLRFWKHRVIQGAGFETLASFDNGLPAILGARIGKGTLVVLASGWHPAESQLALSTKFVPLLYGWLAAAGFNHDSSAALFVGDDLPLDAGQPHRITDPAGKKHELQAGEVFSTAEPGLYQIQSASQSRTIAVNLAPEEGRVLSMETSKLADHGLKLSKDSEAEEESAVTEQRLTGPDTERRQHLWWWFLIALLAVLLLETLVAARSRPASMA